MLTQLEGSGAGRTYGLELLPILKIKVASGTAPTAAGRDLYRNSTTTSRHDSILTGSGRTMKIEATVSRSDGNCDR